MKPSNLFLDVQLAHLFEDSKSFADAICLAGRAEIEAEYLVEKDKPNFELRSFVLKYFTVPSLTESKFKTDKSNSPTEHIHQLWSVLKRMPDTETTDSLIPLPYSYIVPGGRFREIYYWDSYFTMLGLVRSNELELTKSMINNFRFLIENYGFIPNGNRTYFLSRSQPPFYALMIDLMKDHLEIGEYQTSMETEYKFWMDGKRLVTIGNKTLNRYWDSDANPRPESYAEDFELFVKFGDSSQLFLDLRAACESGWDFSSRWLSNDQLSSIHTTQILPVDLNCLLYFLEIMIGKVEEANNRKAVINELMWNEAEGYYFDYNFHASSQTKVQSLAGVFPLFMKIATSEQADRVANYLQNHFLKPGGLVTTTVDTGQQWDAPNGWAPLQWMAVKGLLNYGYKEMANDIARRWTQLNESVFSRTGKFVEKYDVCNLDLEAGGGEYPVQDGFGWSNGVYLALKELIS